MRKSLLLTLGIVALATGCSEPEPPPALPDMDVETAEKTALACISALHAAMAQNNQDDIKRLGADQQCIDASKVLHANDIKMPSPTPQQRDEWILPEDIVLERGGIQMIERKEMSPEEAAAAEKVKAEQEALAAKLTIPEGEVQNKQATLNNINNLSFSDYYALNKRCDLHLVDTRTPYCNLVRSTSEARYAEQVATIKAEYSGEALEQYAKEQCSGDNKNVANCEMALRAKREAQTQN